MDKIDRIVKQWQKEKPHLDTKPMALMGRLIRLTKHLESNISACHKHFALTPGEFDVLATLRRAANHDSLTPSELLNALLVTSGAMTNRLDKLEAKKLISRVHSKQDRRSVTVALTAQGRALIDEAIEAHVKVQHNLVTSLSEQEKTLLDGLLKTWLGQFEGQ